MRNYFIHPFMERSRTEEMEELTDKKQIQGAEVDLKPGKKAWLKRLGIAGFLFFFIKGLVWLLIFFLAGKACL